jgi:putrescine transport system ATP-binding protein
MDVHVAIRPEKIGIQKDAPVADDYDNAVEVGFNCARGEIKSLAYLGSQTIYHVALPTGLVVKVTKANDARHDEFRLSVGDTVHVWWWGSDLVVLTQ